MTETNAQTFNFELVSPEAKLMSEPVKMAVIPGEEGVFGVLPNHSPLMSAIQPGVIELHGENDNEPKRIFIGGGFADVTPESCTVLAEYAVNVSELDKSEIEKTLKNLEEDLKLVEGEADIERVQQKIAIEKAKLTALTGTLVL